MAKKTTFHEALRKFRDGLGASRVDIALKIGVSWRSIYEWERGKRVPRPLQLRALYSKFPDLRVEYPHDAPGRIAQPPHARKV